MRKMFRKFKIPRSFGGTPLVIKHRVTIRGKKVLNMLRDEAWRMSWGQILKAFGGF